MQQNSSSEANISSAFQGNQGILWDLIIHCLVSKIPLLVPVFNRGNPFYVLLRIS
jgi:hypothetical protein